MNTKKDQRLPAAYNTSAKTDSAQATGDRRAHIERMTTDRAYREQQETKEREALDREAIFIRGCPIRPYAPRHVPGAYAFIVVTATPAMLAASAGMLLEGANTFGG